VRAIAELGLDEAWRTGAITLAGALFLFPFMLANKKFIRDANLLVPRLPFTPLIFFMARLHLLSYFCSLALPGAC
jgi:hypothetical protein